MQRAAIMHSAAAAAAGPARRRLINSFRLPTAPARPTPFPSPPPPPPPLPHHHHHHLHPFPTAQRRHQAPSFSSLSDPPALAAGRSTTLPEPTSQPPTQESVLYVLKKLDKNPQKALDFLKCVSDRYGFKPNATAYNLMLRILGGQKDWAKDFWAVAGKMEEEGHSLERGTYLTLLVSFKKQKMAGDASNLAQFYSQATDKADSGVGIRSAVEIVLGSEDRWDEEVGKKLEGVMCRLSELAVIKVLREVRGTPLKALGFFRWAGARPDYKHTAGAYNAMVRVLGRDDSIGDFWVLVEEMKTEGHEMDIDTYIKLSRQFQKSKMVREAVELYEFMMDGPYKPSIHDCGLLLRQISLADTPDLDLVSRVVKKYEANGHSLSKVVYDGIHRSLTSIGKFDEAEQIIRMMKDAGFEPDNITYSQLVFGLCKAKRLDEACKVLDEMEACGCTPDLKTWTVLIQGHCSVGEVDKALTCFANMIEKDYDADGDLLDVLVKGFCSKNRVDAAHTLVVEMVGRARLRPWQATYKLLIQKLLGEGKLEEALKLMGLMRSHNFPPYTDPFAPYISKFGTIEDARGFLKASTTKNYPSSSTYLNVFKSFFKEGRYSEAHDLLFKCPHHIRKHSDISKLFGSVKVGNAT